MRDKRARMNNMQYNSQKYVYIIIYVTKLNLRNTTGIPPRIAVLLSNFVFSLKKH